MDLRDSYDSAADAYAEHLATELAYKPLDRHVDDLFGSPVSLDFRFHVPSVVIEALQRAQLSVIEHIEREPYEGVEYPSRRCYLLARV